MSSKLSEISVDVLDVDYIECPLLNIQVLQPQVVLQYHTVVTNGETITLVPVPNAFVYIDVNNDTPSLAFNVTANVSLLSLGDKVSICFRFSNLNVTNVVTATMLLPIRNRPTEAFEISNVVFAELPGLVALPRYLMDLTFNSTDLMWTYNVC